CTRASPRSPAARASRRAWSPATVGFPPSTASQSCRAATRGDYLVLDSALRVLLTTASVRASIPRLLIALISLGKTPRRSSGLDSRYLRDQVPNRANFEGRRDSRISSSSW